jgi:hypothetical protein
VEGLLRPLGEIERLFRLWDDTDDHKQRTLIKPNSYLKWI